MIRLMMQSPDRLFLYWRYASDPYEELRREFGERVVDYCPVVGLINLTLDRARPLAEASETREHWFKVQPGMRYKAFVGLYALGSKIEQRIESNEVTTPRPYASYLADPISEDKTSECDHILRLYQRGDIRASLEYALKRLDEKEDGEATRTLARELSTIKLPAMKDIKELSAARIALSSLYSGESRSDTSDVSDSQQVSDWVIEIPTNNLKNIDSAATLLESLYSRLGCDEGRKLSNLGRSSIRYSSYILLGASEMLGRARPSYE